MCLIIFAINIHPKYKFILAANRDEFFDRSTEFAGVWTDNDNIIGGKDSVSGGTWLGIHRGGKFVAITNYRDPNRENANALSRGGLSRKYLTDNQPLSQFILQLSGTKQDYNGYNLLLSENGFGEILHYSNITDETTIITNGVHGLSNALMDVAWPKVEYGKKKLKELIAAGEMDPFQLIKMLQRQDEALSDDLPHTGISLQLEKKLSPVFISMNGYGTRCSTALLIDKNNHGKLVEVSYGNDRKPINTSEIEFKLKY
jgi:uncharacterized protein with NRDE domain